MGCWDRCGLRECVMKEPVFGFFVKNDGLAKNWWCHWHPFGRHHQVPHTVPSCVNGAKFGSRLQGSQQTGADRHRRCSIAQDLDIRLISALIFHSGKLP